MVKSLLKKCSPLNDIPIQDTVTEISFDTFKKCLSLTNVFKHLYWTVTLYSKITNITLLNDIEKIGESVFSRYSSLVNIAIPDSVTENSNYAFSECSSLTNITILNILEIIGRYVLFNKTRLIGI